VSIDQKKAEAEAKQAEAQAKQAEANLIKEEKEIMFMDMNSLARYSVNGLRRWRRRLSLGVLQNKISLLSFEFLSY
jgi:short-subunit dehydrogenase